MDRLKCEMAWKELHSASRMPAIRANTQSFVFKDDLYLFLGSGAGISRTNEVWRYNLVNNKWSTYPCKGDTPVERDGHTVTYIGSGKFVVYGGQGKPYENEKSEKLIDRVSIKTWYIRELYNSMYILDANDSTIGIWTRCSEDGVAPMPRRGHTMTYFSTSLLNYSNKSGHTEVECHNVSTQISRTTQQTSKTNKSILSKDKSPGGTTIGNRSLILYGGAGMEPSKYTELIFNDFWSYPAEGGQWTRLQINGAVPHPLFDHRAELVDDTLVIVGGIVGSSNNSTYKENDMNVTDVMILNIHTLTLSYLDLYDARGRTTQLGLHGFSLCIDWSSATDGSKSLLIFGGREIIDSQTASSNENSETNTFGRKKKSKQKQSTILKLDVDRGLLAPVKFKGTGPSARYGHVGIVCKSVDYIYNESRMTPAPSSESTLSHGTSVAIKEEPIMIIYGGSNVVQGNAIGMGGYCDPVMFKLVNTQINLDLLPEDEIGSRPSSAASKSSRLSAGSSMQLSFGEGGVMLRDLEDDDINQVQSKSSVWEKMHASSIQRAKTASGYNNSDTSVTTSLPRNPRNWSELKLALSYPASEKHSIRSFQGGSTAIGEGAMESSLNATSRHQTKSLPKIRESQSAPAMNRMKSSSKSIAKSLEPDTENVVASDEVQEEKKVDLNSLPEHERIAYVKKQEKIRLIKLSQSLKTMGASGGGNNVLRAKEIYYKQFPPPSLQSKLPLHDQEFFCSAPTSMSRKLTSTTTLHHHGSKLDAFDF